ncbi:hypothetical protein [Alteromonas genovensis]|uniref:hypothetical protein n=1 Tax=Alteromonas genovensis TaxID=471225 RepID=UPI002FDFD5DE
MKKTLLWLGAGEAQTPHFDFSEYDQIILVDPLLDQNAFTQSENKKVSVLAKAVTTNSQKASSFYLLNNEELSSFCSPTGLKDIYPNVYVEETNQVPTITLEEIVGQFSIAGSDNTLVIDLPCLSSAIVDSLKDEKTLFLFTDIYASAGKLALYEKSKNIGEISKQLEDAFFEFSEDCSEDTDICLYRFTFSEKLEKISRLNNEVYDLKEQIKLVVASMQNAESEKEELSTLLFNSQTAFSELQTEKVSTDAELDKLLVVNNALEEEIKSVSLVKTQLDKKVTLLNDELIKLKPQRDRIIEERETYKAKTIDLDKRLYEAKSKFESLQSEAAEHSDKLNELTATLSSSQAAFSDLEKEKSSSDSRLNKLLEEHEELQEENKSISLVKTQLDEKVTLLNDELNELKSQRDRVIEERETYKTKTIDLNKKLHGAESKVESLQSEAAEHSDKLNELTGALSSSKAAFAELEQEKESAYNQLNKLLAERDSNEAKAIDLDKKLQEAESKVELLQKEMSESSTKIEALIAGKEDQKHAFDSEIATNQSQIKELEAKLAASEEKQKETYSWFASRKQQADALTKQVEALKRENELLVSKNDTAAAISALESKVSSILQKQSDDNIEIANALGKHVTKCSLEQKSSVASLFELRKLPAFASLPLSYSAYTMDTPNLAELSSLISLNSFDVIVEFGSGLSTIVAASVTDEKLKAKNSGTQLTISKAGEEHLTESFANALPNYVISFEQEVKYLNETKNLLNAASLSEYVDLHHAPLVQSQYSLNGENGVYYDCTEKLLELKRVFSNRNAKVLVIVDGPSTQNDKASTVFAALPTILDYLSQCDITIFHNNANEYEKFNLIKSWENEINRRQLTMKSQHVETPQGAAILRIHS